MWQPVTSESTLPRQESISGAVLEQRDILVKRRSFKQKRQWRVYIVKPGHVHRQLSDYLSPKAQKKQVRAHTACPTADGLNRPTTSLGWRLCGSERMLCVAELRGCKPRAPRRTHACDVPTYPPYSHQLATRVPPLRLIYLLKRYTRLIARVDWIRGGCKRSWHAGCNFKKIARRRAKLKKGNVATDSSG